MSRCAMVVGLTLCLGMIGCKKPETPVQPELPPGPEAGKDEALENALALVGEGKDLLAQQDLAGAKAKVDEALALKPDLEEAKALLGKIEAEEKKAAEEAAKVGAVLESKKKAEELRAQAQSLLDKGDLDKALAAATEAQKLDATPESGQLVDKIESARKEKAEADKREQARKQIEDRALKAEGERKWDNAAKLYAQAAELAAKEADKKAYLKKAAHCMAMLSYEQGQADEKEGRLAAAMGRYAEALKGEPENKLYEAARVRVAEKLRAEEAKKKDAARCKELLGEARSLADEGKFGEAQAALKAAAALEFAGEEQLAEVAAVQAEIAKKRMEHEYGKHVAAADEALAAEPPDYAKAAEELVIAKQIGGLPAELQEKLLACRFHLAVGNGDAAVEAGNLAEAIDYYEEASSYIEDETVYAKLEQVKQRKATEDFDALLAKGDEAVAQGREGEAVDAYEIAMKLVDERPDAFEQKVREVAAVRTKLKNAELARKRKLDAELAGKWSALMKETGALKKDPMALKSRLLEEKETFKDSKFASNLDKLLQGAEKKIDGVLGKDWAVLKKQVGRSEDSEANIQALAEFLEKVRGTNYEQQVQDQLDAEKQAFEEAPPEEPVEPEPVEGAAPPEVPPEPVEEPAAE